MALTAKQETFVQEYLGDLNATQAAIRAGYSEESAGAIGHENLTKPEIAFAIAKQREERSKRTMIDADWLLKRLAQEANADVRDLYDDDGNYKPVSEWPLIWRQGLVSGIETVTEFETIDGKKQAAGHVTKVKVSDRTKRLELIGKHIGVQAFSDRLVHSGPGGGPIKVENQFVFVPVGADYGDGG